MIRRTGTPNSACCVVDLPCPQREELSSHQILFSYDVSFAADRTAFDWKSAMNPFAIVFGERFAPSSRQ